MDWLSKSRFNEPNLTFNIEPEISDLAAQNGVAAATLRLRLLNKNKHIQSQEPVPLKYSRAL